MQRRAEPGQAGKHPCLCRSIARAKECMAERPRQATCFELASRWRLAPAPSVCAWTRQSKIDCASTKNSICAMGLLSDSVTRS
jgi:hypothetical protein